MNAKHKIILFFITDIIFYMAASFAHPVTPTLFTELGLGQYMFGLALASMLTVNFLVSPFWGKLNDFVSSKNILLFSCVGYALGQWLFGISTTEFQFLAARAFTGIFTAGSFVGILNYIVNIAEDDKQRGTYLAIHATVQSVAGAFGYFVGGMLGEISVQTSITAQVITLLATGIFFFLLSERSSIMASEKISVRQIIREANPFSAFAAVKNFINSALVVLFAITVLKMLSSLSFDQSFNYYLRDVFNFSSGYNGLIKAIIGIASLVINSTLILYLIRRGNIQKSLGFLFASCALIMTVALMIVEPVVFIVGNIATIVLINGTMPLMQNMVASFAQSGNRNLIMGFYNAMKSLGNIFGALSAGLLYTLNPKAPFIFGIIVCAILVALSFFIKKVNTKEVKATSQTAR